LGSAGVFDSALALLEEAGKRFTSTPQYLSAFENSLAVAVPLIVSGVTFDYFYRLSDKRKISREYDIRTYGSLDAAKRVYALLPGERKERRKAVSELYNKNINETAELYMSRFGSR
jgi:hypothetical protein